MIVKRIFVKNTITQSHNQAKRHNQAKQKMIKIGIIGGAGYTGGELIRILLHHPKVDIAFIHSQSNAENLVSDVHVDLLGDTDLKFTDQLNFSEIEALFLCTGHGRAKSFIEGNAIPEAVKIIDLSRDYRLKAEGNDFVYGLPELNKTAIQQTNHVANCGCFATAIQLALLPLAKAGLLNNDINVHAITGSTGAGQQPRSTTHFSWRNNNLSIYKAFTHQHLGEIRQSLEQLQPKGVADINFLPVRGDFPRGIYASLFTKVDLSLAEAEALYDDYYKDHPFVIRSAQNPNLKQVVNTNKCVLHLVKHDNKLLIISLIDNLIKGASGQAVQNRNLLFGFPETLGLNLKAVVF